MNGLQTFQYTSSSNLTVLTIENRIGDQAGWEDLTICKRYEYINAVVPGETFFLKGKDIGELIAVLSRYKDALKDNLYD